jgi:hypothetical protein
MNGLACKKTNHKEAEQKRRDTLKYSFQLLKSVLPVTKEKSPSKVQILHHGNIVCRFDYFCSQRSD